MRAVAVMEDTPASTARLEAVGLKSGVSPVVQDVLRRSGCLAQDPKAPLKLRMSVTSISDDHVVNTSVTLGDDEMKVDARGRGQGQARGANGYAAALTLAVADAVNNVIEAYDRASSH